MRFEMMKLNREVIFSLLLLYPPFFNRIKKIHKLKQNTKKKTIYYTNVSIKIYCMENKCPKTIHNLYCHLLNMNTLSKDQSVTVTASQYLHTSRYQDEWHYSQHLLQSIIISVARSRPVIKANPGWLSFPYRYASP